MTLKLLDLFSGIGGFSYAAEELVGGFTTTQFVELDPFCHNVLQKHWPEVPIHADVSTFTAEPGVFDVITAGFPCQDLSIAGKQRGLRAERSGLFYEVIRLAREIRPRFVLFENVGNLLSHQGGETFQEVLFQIAKAGFDAEWAIIPASDVGACHRRKRIWIIAYSQGTRAGQHEPRARRQSEREFMSAAGDSNQKISITAAATGMGSKGSGQRWAATHYLDPNWHSYISEPVLCRGDDGLSGRVDRLKSLGNSIVPQVAAIPLQRIKALSQNLTLI